MGTLSESGRLSTAAPDGFDVPGDASVSFALGYLHANCGNCHNDSPLAVEFIRTFDLRVSVTATSAEATGTYRTAVGSLVEKFVYPGVTHRILPGQPDASCVSFRMGRRGGTIQMPPIATKVVHPEGLTAVSDWITNLMPP